MSGKYDAIDMYNTQFMSPSHTLKSCQEGILSQLDRAEREMITSTNNSPNVQYQWACEYCFETDLKNCELIP